MSKSSITRNIIITGIWICIFSVPPIVDFFNAEVNNTGFSWGFVINSWKEIAIFFLLFLIHNYILIPYTYARKRTFVYVLSVAMLISGYLVFLVNNIPEHAHHIYEHMNHKPMPEHVIKDDIFKHRPEGMDIKRRPMLPPPEVARFIIALLMIGVNLGVDGMVRAHKQKRRLEELEKLTLAQELEHLKRQINPHFLMNTLNNIHVLIDIDQESAKRCLIELSQMMRYMLYECDAAAVPVAREVEFIRLYISLMKIRYSNKVDITYHLPENLSTLNIPPLLLINFIENAFKHGISYQKHSFIDISLSIDDNDKTLHFVCRNSRHIGVKKEKHGGIGLENVRKRLDMIFGNEYSLSVIDNNPETFSVSLQMPARDMAFYSK